MIKVIHDFLDRDYCKAFTLYALNERLENFHPYSRNPKETPGPKTHGRHSDSFAQASLKAMMPKVQRYFKQKEIYPSYSFYIVYENEARLDPHTDQDACEISVTVPTGYFMVIAIREIYGLFIWALSIKYRVTSSESRCQSRCFAFARISDEFDLLIVQIEAQFIWS